MKSLVLLPLVLSTSLLADTTITSSAADRSSLNITVYNSNRALIEETRTLKLPKGEATLRFSDVSSQIQPQTLIISAKGVRILEQNYEFDLINQRKLMDKYVGKTVQILRENQYKNRVDTVEALLLSNNGTPIFQIGDEIHLGISGRVVLPSLPENLYARPTMNWLIHSKGGTPNATVSYLTTGLSWAADYVLRMDKNDKLGNLVGWVTLTNNSGATYDDAQLKLVAGEVNTVQSRPRSHARMYKADMMMEAAPAPAAMQEKAFDEYHLYTLPRLTSIRDKQTKQVELLSANGIKTTKYYRVEGNGYGPEKDGKTTLPVNVELSFKTGKKNNLDMALPAGVIRLYKEDSDGGLIFIGEDRVRHTPKNEEVRLKTGEAFDLVCERREVRRDRQSRKEITTIEITLKNRKNEAVTFLYDAPVWGTWKIESSEHWKQLNAQKIRFDVTVLADQEVTFQYTLSRSWK